MNKSKKIFLLIFLVALALPFLSSAQEVTLQSMAQAAANTALYVASGVIVILWVVTGVLFLIAQGDPSKLGTARMALLTSVVGTAIVIIANMNAKGFVGGIFGIKGQ